MNISPGLTSPESAAQFDIGGALPDGVTVLEASAGTGKTYAIAALAVRYIAEGIPLERLLVVTFTRMATGELRDRLRGRLIDAHQGLRRVLDDDTVPDDDLLAVLATGTRTEVDARCRRLGRAIAQFDAMTVATTHSFCQQILAGLGIAADGGEALELLDDPAELVDQVVDDLYLHAYQSGAHTQEFTHKTARNIGRAVAVDNATAAVVPRHPVRGSKAAARVRFAAAVREEFARRKARLGLVTYDDYQLRLRDLIADPHGGEALAQRLREAFAVVLIDEFQDTDPIQWEIVERAFATGPTVLVLIGDPKQAIYAFRGADVQAYLAAVGRAARTETLPVSWRSDAGLLRGLDAVFDGARLGPEQIVYRPLDPAPQGAVEARRGLPHGAPVRVRVLDRRTHPSLLRKDRTSLLKDPAREAIAADLARDVVGLLASGADIDPGGIAVLVRTNREALTIRSALGAAGVPAVVAGAGSVFATPMADAWSTLLDALERPASRSHAAAAALTVFIGWGADRAAAAAEDDWELVHERLARWRGVLRGAGVAALFAEVSRDGLVARTLRRTDGERDYTDLRHIGQLLHAAALEDGVRASGLGAWLAERMRSTARDANRDERTRRLDSDADAVQVLTIHRSKGLEFPVVYCPYLSLPGQVNSDFPVFHEADTGAPRVVALYGRGDPDHETCAERALEEERGEELRLAYVALTRACHQVVLWWAVVQGSEHSPLARLLFAKEPNGAIPPRGTSTRTDAEVLPTLAARAARHFATVAVETVERAAPPAFVHARGVAPRLSVARFARAIDAGWRRTSYSGIVAAVHRDWAAEGRGLVREDDEGPGASGPNPRFAADGPPRWPIPLPLAEMPASAEVGTVLHAVLERVSFAADDPVAAVRAVVREEVTRQGTDLGDSDIVARALVGALATPLGPDFGDRTLLGIPDADRRTELGFEIPLGGGDHPRGATIVADIARVLHDCLPAGDPLHAYADRLAAAEFGPVLLRGYLTGFIDAVLRWPGGPGEPPRYGVIDYKSNLLGAHGVPATSADYRPEAVAQAMYAADYPLQALLYLVALYRYLRWRIPARDPDDAIAGVAYLFVRGMLGPDGPRIGAMPSGVWTWRPPRGLIVAVSDLLDGGTP
jgi:exodeoxyribonuclease V beta subunit